jgi:signal transduction histidine kinase/CheY-like chemotaxis protein
VTAALAAACGHIAAAFAADKVDAFLLDPASDTLIALGTSDTPMGRAQHARGLHRLPLANGGRAAAVFQTGEPWQDGHVERDREELVGIREALGVRSTLLVPYAVGGARRGVLQASAARPEAFAAADLRRLAVVARWVGLLAEREEAVAKASVAAHLAALAHELRTPLTSLQLAFGLLDAGDGALPPAARGVLAIGRRNAQRLATLVEDLLAADQLDAGALAIRRAPLDLRAVVAEAATAIAPLLAEQGQTLALALPAPLPLAGDARRLGQVVANLLANAHRHTPRGSRIAVAGRVAGDEVVLTVSDDGPGIPDGELERIFARHHRAGATGGAGLGLAIARELAARHGGRLWAERPPGGGAAFHLALPRTASSPARDTIARPRNGPRRWGGEGRGMGRDEQAPMGDAERERRGRKHLFAINGDPDFLDLVRILFQRAEYNVTTTNFVPATFDQIAALDPDILLVDLVWGQRAGWDLLERLNAEARTRGIPVVVLSTSPAYLERVEADPERYGGQAVLAKPFEVEDLLRTVDGLIGPA